MQAFNQATNFVVEGCYFINNGETAPLSTVLAKLKDEAAAGVSYDSIDHVPSPCATIGAGVASVVTSAESTNTQFVHFINSTSPADARAYGEGAAKHCKEADVLFTSVFLRRLLAVFPAEAKRRLVPSIAYQLAVSAHAPEALKIEILGALFLQPDLPERNLAEQFDRLVVRPLRHVRGLLQPNAPVVFVLDSVQNVDCDAVGAVIRDVVHAVGRLQQDGVNARAIITGVKYDRIVQAFQGAPDVPTNTTVHAMPISDPASISSKARSFSFHILNWKFGCSEIVQRVIEVVSVVGTCMTLPPLIMTVAMAVLPTPLNILVAVFGPIFLTMGFSVGVTVFAYSEMARLLWPRSI